MAGRPQRCGQHRVQQWSAITTPHSLAHSAAPHTLVAAAPHTATHARTHTRTHAHTHTHTQSCSPPVDERRQEAHSQANGDRGGKDADEQADACARVCACVRLPCAASKQVQNSMRGRRKLSRNFAGEHVGREYARSYTPGHMGSGQPSWMVDSRLATPALAPAHARAPTCHDVGARHGLAL